MFFEDDKIITTDSKGNTVEIEMPEIPQPQILMETFTEIKDVSDSYPAFGVAGGEDNK